MDDLVTESVSADDTIKSLLRNYGVYEDLVIDNEEEKIMVIMALTQSDIIAVKIDEDGALCIQYEGDNWQNEGPIEV